MAPLLEGIRKKSIIKYWIDKVKRVFYFEYLSVGLLLFYCFIYKFDLESISRRKWWLLYLNGNWRKGKLPAAVGRQAAALRKLNQPLRFERKKISFPQNLVSLFEQAATSLQLNAFNLFKGKIANNIL